MTAMVRLTIQDLVVSPTKGSMPGQTDSWLRVAGTVSEGLKACFSVSLLISYHLTNKNYQFPLM
jgi:hypothetical protein